MKNILFYLPLLLLVACQTGSPGEKTEPAATAGNEMKMADPALQSLFEEVNVVKMHLFSTISTSPSEGEYPYVGKPITEEALSFLSDDLKPNGNGGSFACYHTENSNHYILRVPGPSASNSLVLAKWDPNSQKLVKVIELASLTCNKGNCDQQDAWLADLDDSRTLELIVRKRTLLKGGESTNEEFMVLTDDGNGAFVKSNEKLAALAIQENYVMQ